MTNSTITYPKVVTALRDGLSISVPAPGVALGHYAGIAAPAGVTFNRGDELELSDDIVEVNRDRTGTSPWDDIQSSTKWAAGGLHDHPDLEAEVLTRNAAEEAERAEHERLHMLAQVNPRAAKFEQFKASAGLPGNPYASTGRSENWG